MGFFDFLPATRGDLKTLEAKMNQTIADFKARMDGKFAAANAKLDNVEADEAGLNAKQAELEQKIKDLEAKGPSLGVDDLKALADLETEYDALVTRTGKIADAVPDAIPPAAG